MEPVIKIKRVYERPLKQDGYRVLVDRLWPRGISKEVAAVGEWAKTLAPSPALRKWFGHDPEKWPEFQKKYLTELEENKDITDFIERHEGKKMISLIYAAKDNAHAHALVLSKYLVALFHGN